ncbi:MAG: hypothetical protein AAGC93_31125 [Cyanobacteria bacterium P01_F01_bin.53]
MADSAKAARTTVKIGVSEVDAFQLPDGSYRMSQADAAAAVELSRRNASDFLRSKAIKSLLGEGYTGTISDREEIEVEPEAGKRGSTRFMAMPLEAVAAYWQWQSFRGNKKALALCMALMTESLERRFDSAFGVQRTEDEYNQALARRVRELETSMTKLAEGMAEPDTLREYVSRLEEQIRQLGAEPWQISGGTQDD